MPERDREMRAVRPLLARQSTELKVADQRQHFRSVAVKPLLAIRAKNQSFR
jgi:hypothetical protein